MTHIKVEEIAPSRTYTVTTAQDEFAAPFPFFYDGQIKVYVDDLPYLTWTLTGELTDNGGQLTTDQPLTDDTIRIYRDTPIRRVTDFPLSGPFDIEQLNTELDTMTMIDQESRYKIEHRTLYLPEQDRDFGRRLPPRPERAGLFLAFDVNGDPIATMPSGIGDGMFIQVGDGAVYRPYLDKVREQPVSPEDYGAATTYSDAYDDIPFIQKAIDAANYKWVTYGVPTTIKLIRTYRLASTTPTSIVGTGDPTAEPPVPQVVRTVMLDLKPGAQFQGPGGFKVADGMAINFDGEGQGYYYLMLMNGHTEGPEPTFLFDGITIDWNPAGNPNANPRAAPVIPEPGNAQNSPMQGINCNPLVPMKLEVRNCIFKDVQATVCVTARNNSSDDNYFGYVRSAVFDNNQFLNVGVETGSRFETFDHSTIHAFVDKNGFASVTRNRFIDSGWNGKTSNTPFEVHAGTIIATGNYVFGYRHMAILLGADQAPLDSMLVTDNFGQDVGAGFDIWSRQYNRYAGDDWDYTVRLLNISRNHILMRPSRHAASWGWGDSRPLTDAVTITGTAGNPTSGTVTAIAMERPGWGYGSINPIDPQIPGSPLYGSISPPKVVIHGASGRPITYPVPELVTFGSGAEAVATLQATGVVDLIYVLDPGEGYLAAPAITISNGATATAVMDGGHISYIEKLSSGSAVAADPIVTIDPPPAGGRQATAKTIITRGVASVAVTAPGSGYASVGIPFNTLAGGQWVAGQIVTSSVSGKTATIVGWTIDINQSIHEITPITEGTLYVHTVSAGSIAEFQDGETITSGGVTAKVQGGQTEGTHADFEGHWNPGSLELRGVQLHPQGPLAGPIQDLIIEDNVIKYLEVDPTHGDSSMAGVHIEHVDDAFTARINRLLINRNKIVNAIGSGINIAPPQYKPSILYLEVNDNYIYNWGTSDLIPVPNGGAGIRLREYSAKRISICRNVFIELNDPAKRRCLTFNLGSSPIEVFVHDNEMNYVDAVLPADLAPIYTYYGGAQIDVRQQIDKAKWPVLVGVGNFDVRKGSMLIDPHSYGRYIKSSDAASSSWDWYWDQDIEAVVTPTAGAFAPNYLLGKVFFCQLVASIANSVALPTNMPIGAHCTLVLKQPALAIGAGAPLAAYKLGTPAYTPSAVNLVDIFTFQKRATGVFETGRTLGMTA